jgi:HNH endonuclease
VGAPQVTVTIELASLLGQPGLPAAESGWVGPLSAETARRLACDAAVTRVLVTRHPHQPDRDGGTGDPAAQDDGHPAAEDSDSDPATGLAARLRTAMTLLPPALGGARPEPLEAGRATRVVTPAQRTALTVRDGGCRFPSRDRPVAWCDGHHLRHWLHGGPTDLGNLVLLCRGHHRAVHEGGWRLHRHPDGTITATPPHRRRQPTAA